MPTPLSVGTGTVVLSIGLFFWELIKIFLLAMAIIIPVRYFLVQPFFVRGASMEPTYLDGEYLIIDEFSYRFVHEPERGDVVVFRYPEQPSQYFIKRIVGLPNETVRVENGQVIIQNEQHPQGAVLNESEYLPAEVRTGGKLTTILKDSEFFVLGDNRPASSDSRSWGVLPRADIIGRVWVRAYPVDRWDIMSSPEPGFVNL
jgi:signal peptidase I